MNLKKTIEDDIKKAMLAKDKAKLTALRGIKAAILLAETEKGASSDLNQDAEIKLLMKAAKQRKDAADLYEENGRLDLATAERAELEIINQYLPQQLSEEELKEELKTIIAQVGASGPQDMGKVMGAATSKLAGRADGKMISFHVKNLLQS